MDRERRRNQRTQQALAAVVAEARTHGLGVDEPVVLNDLFSLMVHLRPAPVVARVATCMPRLRSPIEDWLAREIDVTTYLMEQGAPVAGPSRELPPGPHARDGFTFSFWTYFEPDPERTTTAADSAAMLAELHAVLRSYPGDLPKLAVDDIARGLELLDQTDGVVSEAERELLRATAAELRPFLDAPGGAVQPLHGDAHPGNLIATREGLVWIDFEDVCLGPVEWDLASMMDAGVIENDRWADPDVLAQCTRLRALQVALVLIAFHDDFGDRPGWNPAIRHLLDLLARDS